MSFWRDNMPKGMFLRSPYVASSIDDPDGALDITAFAAASGEPVGVPVPLDRFLDYGRWFQEQVAPGMDRRRVASVARSNGGFALDLGDGDVVRARRVVVAAGVAAFNRVPRVFAGLGPERASHASEHAGLSQFAGRRVAVIGGGQSALESAALLHEAGATVEVLVRRDAIVL